METLAHHQAPVRAGPAVAATVATRTEDHPVAPIAIREATAGRAALIIN